MTHRVSETEVGGETVMTLAGERQMPYRGEHPCFGRCGGVAEWKVDALHICLHFCSTCKAGEARKGGFSEAEGYTWYPLRAR